MLHEEIRSPEEVEMLDVTTVVLEASEQCEIIHTHYDLGEKALTLSGIRQRYENENHILVITEYGLEGYVYRYGNHGDYWEKVGETCGYA